MDATKNQSQYVNTMVFAVVAGILSLMLLLLVMNASEMVRRYSAFIITVEVGLVLIIAVAIWQIIAFESAAAKNAKNMYDNLLAVKTCPDYWTTSGTTCINAFTSSTDPTVTYTIQGLAPGEEGAGAAASTTPTTDPIWAPQSVDLTTYNNKTIIAACQQAEASVNAPWSDVRAVCDSYRV